ncbi:MAG: hypothetical protein AMJ90_05000 [candidate division Zixibacteria bacterium SM23_73_2]|nr:MAG: hypothetical protein AMJ90_05000 [candidate division Zixibacteria bacterium SM23_73_2]
MANLTLDYLRGRRMWLVRNFVVWGEGYGDDFLFLYTQLDSPDKRIVFNNSFLGGEAQEVNFSSLYDFKGNQLPATIDHPKVVVLPRKEPFCFVLGSETESGFKISRKKGAEENGLVDLLIVEMG